MNFNTKKSKFLPITRKRSSISAPLRLDGTPLEAATEISDLGLLTDYKLSYNSRKTNVVLGLHRRNCRDLRDISTLRTLYYALVRPEVENHYQKYRDTKYTKCCKPSNTPGEEKQRKEKHKCGVTQCPVCQEDVDIRTHKCFIQPTEEEKHPRNDPRFP